MKIPPRILTPEYRSGDEKRYAEYLDLLYHAGEILDWFYEPCKWKMADKTYYVPDFLVIYPDRIEFVEVKGYEKGRFGEKGVLKFKAIADKFPYFAWKLVSWRNKQWETLYEL